MKKVITIINKKGGTGKTSTSVNLGGGLGLLGKNVLVIDLDFQANATMHFGMRKWCEKTMTDVLINNTDINEAIYPSGEKNIDIIGSDENLSIAKNKLSESIFREKVLYKALQSIKKQYDYVLIDCRPDKDVLEINALFASQYIIVPSSISYFSVEGFSQLMQLIQEVKGEDFDFRSFVRILVTIFDKRNKNFNDWIREEMAGFEDIVFETVIRRNISIEEAPAIGKTIQSYKNKSNGAQDYNSLSKELLSIW